MPPIFEEEDLLPLSALQHLLFCERRAALVHLEAIWDVSASTVAGSLFHERTHNAEGESRGEVRIARGLRLRSLRLGLTGKADVVEFHRIAPSAELEEAHGLAAGIALEGARGLWRPFPVEYKVGKLRHERGYEVQLCAQGLCLEEMLNVCVPAGAIFYGKTARRLEITFDEELRHETETAAVSLHEIMRSGKTPKARYEKKCAQCSLLSVCMPKATSTRRSVRSYLARALQESEEEGP